VEAAADFETEELGRCDADDVVVVAIELQRFPHCRHLPAEFPLPEPVPEYDGRPGAAANVVGRREEAADQRTNAERRDIDAADPHAARISRLAVRVHVEGRRAPGREPGEGILARTNLFEERIGELRCAARELAGSPVTERVDPNVDKLRWIVNWQRPD